MAETKSSNSALGGNLSTLISRVSQSAGAPLERWNPPDCGDIDMKIARDGTWFYLGSAIRRPALVKLFASVLMREAGGRYVLITPVEKIGITVEDAPFLAVEMTLEGEGEAQAVGFRTHLDDWVIADAEHPITYGTAQSGEAFKPYVLVRRGLNALLTRALTFDLADKLTEENGQLGIWSSGIFFPVPPLTD